MTSFPPVQAVPDQDATHPLRLRLRSADSHTGPLDGAWWPRSRELTVELPALGAALAERLGQLRRVSYSLAGWDSTTRSALVSGHIVRLEGFPTQDSAVVHLLGADRRRVSLLVVPVHAGKTAGRLALDRACAPDNTDSPQRILAAAGILSGGPVLRGKD
ncbi:DUF5994 family protein [Kutzneria viridogrisea]|uniref:Uncharacterized protein n=1 Tax=Kutzneria viridogrisea TaxID=47990 RepID=A0ABR6BNL5_9PSEU|nr:hypothetical protein [Kutzneria viridogrisea]